MKVFKNLICIILVIQIDIFVIKAQNHKQIRLLQIDTEIKTLQKITSIYFKARCQLLSLNSNNQQICQVNSTMTELLQNKEFKTQYNFRLSQTLCGIEGNNINKKIIKSNSNIFIGINQPNVNQFSIYSTECELINIISNLQVQFILSSRSNYAETIYFIGNGNLCSFQQINVNKFENFRVLSKIDAPVAGGFIRSKDNTKIDIFLVFTNGDIKKYDQMGTLQLTIVNEDDEFLKSQKLQSKIQVIDRYPHPLLLENEWIYTIDTTKYSKQISDCPYIPNIKYIYLDSSYSSIIYVLSENKIYLLQLKGSKKTCYITKIYTFDSKTEQNNLILHGNTIFMSNVALNLTSMETYSINCQVFSIQHMTFQKGKRRQEAIMIDQCCKNQKCLVKISTGNQKEQESYVFIWIILGFIVIMVFAFKFFRKSSSDLHFDYDQQQKYNTIKQQIASCVEPIKNTNKKTNKKKEK